jgi:hypothetical protein
MVPSSQVGVRVSWESCLLNKIGRIRVVGGCQEVCVYEYVYATGNDLLLVLLRRSEVEVSSGPKINTGRNKAYGGLKQTAESPCKRHVLRPTFSSKRFPTISIGPV